MRSRPIFRQAQDEEGERTSARLGYRSGYYTRTLVTRVGKLELRVPQDREGRFSTELFERYQRSEQALVASLAEMYVQGVSTRKVKAVTEELCGHAFSASAISAINQRLDQSLAAFAQRRLEEPFAYLILDARYEMVREAGIVRSQAVLVAVGIDWDGRRQILAVELANRESRSSWKDFLLGLRERGLHGPDDRGRVEDAAPARDPGRPDARRQPVAVRARRRHGAVGLGHGRRALRRRGDAGAVYRHELGVRRDVPRGRRGLSRRRDGD